MRVRDAFLAIALAPAACSRGTAPPPPAAKTWAYEKEFNQGAPVRLALRLDRTTATLADTLVLEEELHIDPGFEAEFPEYLPEDFEGFSVVEINHPGRRSAAPDAPPQEKTEPGADSSPTAGASPTASSTPAPASAQTQAAKDAASGPRVLTKRLTLEPDRSGSLAVAPLAVYFRQAGATSEQSFLTEEIPVTVAALESVKDLSLEPLHGVYETPPDAAASYALVYVAVAAGAAVVITALAYYLLRRRRVRLVRLTPPHELAYESLRRLVALGLLEKGQVELFFIHLSAILREYIERRFDVRAPERTTEEFLGEAGGQPALALHRARLSEFLSLCDQVKFALHEPNESAIQGAFDAVKQFLQETTPLEAKAA